MRNGDERGLAPSWVGEKKEEAVPRYKDERRRRRDARQRAPGEEAPCALALDKNSTKKRQTPRVFTRYYFIKA